LSLRKYLIAIVVIVTIIVSSAVLLVTQGLLFPGTQPSCNSPLGNAKTLKSSVKVMNFGAVTKFQLPLPGRDPNAITVSPDGTVWFGEQAVPGVGHLYPNNGTLVEYAWPGNYSSPSRGPSSCPYKTDIWGLALWNGSVWGSDGVGNRLVGLNPVTGFIQSIKLPTSGSFPYALTVGPEKSLWFTEPDASRVGRLFPNGTLREYKSPDMLPSQIVFANRTLGYLVTVGASSNPVGHVYAFDPSETFSPRAVGGGKQLYAPDSVAVTEDGLGVIQHGPSQIEFYNFSTGQWVTYPTSTVNYTNTVLPYFAVGNGSMMWFNEHYGNRIGEFNLSAGTLMEFNEADPPPKNISQIDNTLTIALGKSKLWFTEWTANYVGFVDASYRPTFSVAVLGNTSLTVRQGEKSNLTLVVSGHSLAPLSLQTSDSEAFTALPKNITILAYPSSIQALNGHQEIRISIYVASRLPVGVYTLAFTVTDGLISYSAYVRLIVSAG